MNQTNFTWAELAFGSKKPISELDAVFIAAPREMSKSRLSQLIKTYIPHSNIIFGIADEEYIAGFEGQPQFKTLQLADVVPLQTKLNAAKLEHKILTLGYAQRDFKYLLEKLSFKKVLLVNGSWQYMFHVSPAYHVISSKKMNYEYISPFANEEEAIIYAKTTPINIQIPAGEYSDIQMLQYADTTGKQSYDYCFQTGATLGKQVGNLYTFIVSAFNKVVPYQAYAMHHGSLREKNFSPMNDLNYYDTVHAETAIVIEAANSKLELNGTTLFINLLPCPSCARMLCETPIKEVVYRQDHSEGYAITLLEAAGIKVRRVVY